MNTGHVLSNQMWEIAGRYLCIACEVSLYHVKRLMTPFLDQSDQCQGDIGQVKIVVENHNSSSPTSSSFSSPVRNAELKMKQMNEQVCILVQGFYSIIIINFFMLVSIHGTSLTTTFHK